MIDLFYILICLGVIVILIFFIDWGNKDDFELNSKIIGFGKAKGLYIIKMENYYVVAGMRVKAKRKAIKEFMHLVDDNGFLPPGMYFKTFGDELIKPIVSSVRVVERRKNDNKSTYNRRKDD